VDPKLVVVAFGMKPEGVTFSFTDQRPAAGA